MTKKNNFIIATALVCITVIIGIIVLSGNKNDENYSSNNDSSNIVNGLISDFVECVVDIDCEDIETSGVAGAYRYKSKGTINIDISKFSSKNLHFENVKVKLVIYLSNSWKFSSNTDVEDWGASGYQMTKIITLSSGGTAHFSTNIILDYTSTGLYKNPSMYENPRVSAYIYKESGTIREL